MKNLFLRIFHLSDYQAVTGTTKNQPRNSHKILIFGTLQALTKDCGHAHRKYWLISQNTHIYSGVLKKYPHGNTRSHPERSEASPRRQQSLVTTAPPLSKKYRRRKGDSDIIEFADISE